MDSKDAVDDSPKPSRLLLLAPELRLIIYDYYISEHIEINPLTGAPKPFDLKLTCRLIHYELKPVIKEATCNATKFSIVVGDFNFNTLVRACEHKLPQPVTRSAARKKRLAAGHPPGKIIRPIYIHIHVQLELSHHWRNSGNVEDLRDWIVWLARHQGFIVTYAEANVDSASTSFQHMYAYTNYATRLMGADQTKLQRLSELVEGIHMGAVKWWVRHNRNPVAEDDFEWMAKEGYEAAGIYKVAGVRELDRFGV